MDQTKEMDALEQASPMVATRSTNEGGNPSSQRLYSSPNEGKM
jgi:hypothetical protein